MKPFSFIITKARALSTAMVLAWSLGFPKPALAIPVLANGQGGVNCGLCHTAVPQLNSYGRYVLMTNFSRGLNKHLQMMQNRSLPVALEASVHSALVQFLSAGFIGPKVSYFASVPVETGGFPASAVDQLWVAYNGLARGEGSLQIGKFPTPVFAPWTSQPLSLSGYGLANLQVGSNDSMLADNRWGASYTQVGHLGWIGNVSYLTGAGPIESAFHSAGEGAAWTGSIQYLSPESRWSGGIAGLRGSYPLPSGASDSYTREAALASYSGDRYELMAMGIVGRDDNPNDGASPPANSHGVSFETIYGPLPWLHVDLRYEHTDDGLGSSTVNYIADAAFNLRPNVIVTLEDLASAGKRPALNYQVLWAGPWYRNRFPPGAIARAMPVPASADAAAIANGRSIFFTGKDVNGARITTADPSRFYQSCAVCHGPNGAGGVRLADGAVSARLGPHAHMLDRMGSMSSMSSMGSMTSMSSMGPLNGETTPWTVALFERAISAGVDNNGDTLSPVMPRWKMSKRDLHDISLYVLTQIR
ncbi:MAG: hypothetical protein ACYDG0_04420 [Vulcanimicrobiaceae bacterium]